MAPNGVDLVDEYDARRGFFALLEHVADAACANANKHFNKVGAADGKEGDIGLACDGARQQRLARARRADHQHALGNAAAEFLKFFRVTQKLDELLHFIFCFLNTGDITKCDLILVPGEHPRFRFAEIKRAFSSHPDLLAKQEIKHQQEKGDRQETNHGLREHVGFRFDGGLHAGRSEFFLQIVRETQIHGGSKRHRLRWRWPYSLTDVSPAQCLRWPAVLYHQLERIIFVVSDLLIFQQLEKTVIRHVFDRLHPAAVKEHRHRNQTKSDHDKYDAAPIEIGFVSPGLIFPLRVAIELSHTNC